MPNLRKKCNKKVNSDNGNDNLIGDVTIDDFANSSRTHARLRKAVINGSSEVKEVVTEEEDLWSEMEEDYESNDLNKSKKGTSVNRRRSRKASSSEEVVEETEEGIDYPLDIWFIISEYICPEAVGKFARICKSAYHVTTSAKFWFHLYKSYYKFVPNLPERLQPQCMVRTYGLRACVIRTMHYTYFPLKRKIDDTSYFRHQDPHSLVKRRCCLMWHRKGKIGKDRWYFYFKLKEIQKNGKNSLRQRTRMNNREKNFVETLDDIAANPEEDCKILMVTCLKYSMLPPVIGLTLQSVSMTLMPGFKDHRLQLGFGTSDIPNTSTNQVVLNEVINCLILDWWHPTYPHQDTIPKIQLPPSDFWEQSLQ